MRGACASRLSSRPAAVLVMRAARHPAARIAGHSPTAEDVEVDLDANQIERRVASVLTGHDFTRLVSEILRRRVTYSVTSLLGPDQIIDIVAGCGGLGFERFESTTRDLELMQQSASTFGVSKDARRRGDRFTPSGALKRGPSSAACIRQGQPKS